MKNLLRLLFILFVLFTFTNTQSVYAEQSLPLTTEASILVEASTGTTLHELNSDEKKYPASITKIATVIYAIEHGTLDDIVTISYNARRANGTRVYLEEGEQVTLEKLLYGTMINSGNDAATAIAEHISGTEEQFALDMTNYFKHELGITNTNFMNASGLYDDNHYTTAADMAKIVQYAMKNEQFMQIFNADRYRWIGQSWDTTLRAHHKMVNGNISYLGITGGKNGYVPESRYTLVTTAEQNNMHLIAITLSGTQRQIYTDTKLLFDYGFEQFQLKTIEPTQTYKQFGRSFMLPDTVSFYIPIGASYETAVTKDGYLEIKTNDGLVKKAKLLDVTPIDEIKSVEKSSINPITLNDRQPLTIIILGIVIVCIIAYFIFTKRRK